MRLTKKSKKILAAVAIIGLAGGGVAYSYWTTTGSGTGTAGTGTTTTLTVAQTSAPVGLAPNAPAQALDFSVTNPGTGAVQVTGLVIAFATTTGCVAGDFTITQPTFAATTIAPGATTTFTSGAGGTVASTTAAIRMIDSTINQDTCKSKTVNLTYSVS